MRQSPGKEIYNIIKMMVGNLSGFPVQHHEPGRIPGLCRGLGDELLGQVIIEIVGLHLWYLIHIWQHPFLKGSPYAVFPSL